jgi:hypothetical protein
MIKIKGSGLNVHVMKAYGGNGVTLKLILDSYPANVENIVNS